MKKVGFAAGDLGSEPREGGQPPCLCPPTWCFPMSVWQQPGRACSPSDAGPPSLVSGGAQGAAFLMSSQERLVPLG